MTDVQSVFQRGLDAPVSGPHRRGSARVAVIGAGAAGICAAKYLLAAGFDVTVFELGSRVGGMWLYGNDSGRSSAYRTLHINTSRGVTRFSDLDFDDATQPFPDHYDMHRYLEAYADHFAVTPRIRFRTRVTALRPALVPGAFVPGAFVPGTLAAGAGAPAWDVTTDPGGTERFDAVIVATGHLSAPLDVPMFAAFGGEYLHSHHYREPEPYVGKRVCVIGVGNSACDIASDLCVTSARTVLVARSGAIILPKLMFGRAFTDITAKIQRPWIPRAIRQRITRFLAWLAHGDITKLGFKPPAELVHTTSNATVVTDIAYRRIAVKQGIEAVEGRRIRFSDGTVEEFDTLIAATGYRIDLDFIPPEIVPATDNRLDLWLRIVPPGWPGLFFMGFFNTDTALNMVFEHQARFVREILLGNAAPPSPETMRQAVAARAAWYASRFKHTPRHTIEEEHVRYLNDLRRATKEMVGRARSAPARSAAA